MGKDKWRKWGCWEEKVEGLKREDGDTVFSDKTDIQTAIYAISKPQNITLTLSFRDANHR